MYLYVCVYIYIYIHICICSHQATMKGYLGLSPLCSDVQDLALGTSSSGCSTRTALGLKGPLNYFYLCPNMELYGLLARPGRSNISPRATCKGRMFIDLNLGLLLIQLEGQ